MFSGNDGYSLSDVASVVKDADGFGNSGCGWWIIILILLFGGFGGNGWGNNNRNVATTEDVYGAVDQQTLLSKIDKNTYGIADSTYALNNTITSGFSAGELGRANMQSNLTQQINNNAVNAMQNTNAIISQMNTDAMQSQQNFCNTNHNISSGIADLGYNLATQSCNTRQAVQDSTQQILSAINAQSIEAKDSKIAEQAQQIFALQLAASQQAQNAYLINQLQPIAKPAYLTSSPYSNYTTCGCGTV